MPDLATRPAPTVDLGPVVDALLRDVQGRVERIDIERLLGRLLDQQFADARVTTYLPILLHRAARQVLMAPGRPPAATQAAPRPAP